MFAVTVRDHMMVAHSFTGQVFGPAQRLHGATFVVDATFRGTRLDADGIVIDIGLATQALREVLAGFNYQNLDEVLPGMNTTSEVLAQTVADRLAALIGGRAGTTTALTITLHESHVAWASYERAL